MNADRARDLFVYDRTTGALTWRAKPAPRAPVCVGGVAGTLRQDGYRSVMVDGRHYMVHRLIWLIETGRWPTDEIDHQNRDRADNRWSNLRPATSKQNRENQTARSGAGGMFRGVSWSRRRNIWRAQIGHHGRSVYLGEHKTLVDAVAARLAGERKHFTHSEAASC